VGVKKLKGACAILFKPGSKRTEGIIHKGTLACLLCLLVLVACAGSRYEVIRPPLRDAGLYPLAQTRAGVSVAVDETAERIERYLSEISLTESLLGINERYQGALFFEVVEPRQEWWPSFTVWTLFPEWQLKLNVHLTVDVRGHC
jgi:hypothetical protein